MNPREELEKSLNHTLDEVDSPKSLITYEFRLTLWLLIAIAKYLLWKDNERYRE